jgi:hypothetical protein
METTIYSPGAGIFRKLKCFVAIKYPSDGKLGVCCQIFGVKRARKDGDDDTFFCAYESDLREKVSAMRDDVSFLFSLLFVGLIFCI